MIQRIQSVWLFLAAMANGALLMPSMVLYKYELGSFAGLGSAKELTATNHFPLLIVAAIMTLLPLVSVFMFANRKRQKGMAVMTIIAISSFLTLLLMKVSNIRNSNQIVRDSYGILGVLLPILAIVFLILAIRGINKDEKLIRSLDRLR